MSSALFTPHAHPTPHGFYRFGWHLVKFLGRRLLKLDNRTISGAQHLPSSGGFILASNHASHLDPPVLAAASHRQLTFLAKKELFANAAFARVISSLGAFPIERGKGDLKAFETSVAFLKEGHALVVFPEGTRTLTGRIGRVRTGAARLAIRAQAPIVPAYISGTFKAWPKKGRFSPAPVTVSFAPPIMPKHAEDTAEHSAELNRELEEILRRLESEHGA